MAEDGQESAEGKRAGATGERAGQVERSTNDEYERRAEQLELEAAALKEAVTITETQRKLREAAELEAVRAREELELMRKQMDAMQV